MSAGKYTFRLWTFQAWHWQSNTWAGAGDIAGSPAYETARHVLYGTSLVRHTLHSTTLERHALKGATP